MLLYDFPRYIDVQNLQTGEPCQQVLALFITHMELDNFEHGDYRCLFLTRSFSHVLQRPCSIVCHRYHPSPLYHHPHKRTISLCEITLYHGVTPPLHRHG
jgi:hypothetical protein